MHFHLCGHGHGCLRDCVGSWDRAGGLTLLLFTPLTFLGTKDSHCLALAWGEQNSFTLLLYRKVNETANTMMNFSLTLKQKNE